MSTSAISTQHVTCLGCGCSCDDIDIVVRDGRIAEARHACALGAAWFGDGVVPVEIRSGGQLVSLDNALADAAAMLTGARRVLVYLAPDISCDAQRAAIAIADKLHAVVDSVSSATVAAGILAAQRRGRVAATFTEVRNRADLLVYWAVDPAQRYPRFSERYGEGAESPLLAAGRSVIAVDVGSHRGPDSAAERVAFAGTDETRAIHALRAHIAGRALGDAAGDVMPRAVQLADRIAAAHYPVIVYDAEPDGDEPLPARAESLTALAQALNARGRCSLCALRAGGNRAGAEAVLTWQTGYPMTVDFSRGVPRYRPDDTARTLLRRGDVDVLLCVGDPSVMRGVESAGVRRIMIGPRASAATPAAEISVDTGVAGIHAGGVAFRMDDVPLPLRPPLSGPLDPATVLAALAARVRA